MPPQIAYFPTDTIVTAFEPTGIIEEDSDKEILAVAEARCF